MRDFRSIETQILANGRVAGPELEALRRIFATDAPIDRQAADFLVVLHKRVRQHSPAFDQFFYQSIKRHLLHDSRIDAEAADWLRQILFQDGAVSDDERELLRELKGEANGVSPEFERLCSDCMRKPAEARTAPA